jgi:hypothetical protein
MRRAIVVTKYDKTQVAFRHVGIAAKSSVREMH